MCKDIELCVYKETNMKYGIMYKTSGDMWKHFINSFSKSIYFLNTSL